MIDVDEVRSRDLINIIQRSGDSLSIRMEASSMDERVYLET